MEGPRFKPLCLLCRDGREHKRHQTVGSLVRCPDCHELHGPSEACVPSLQELLPLWQTEGA